MARWRPSSLGTPPSDTTFRIDAFDRVDTYLSDLSQPSSRSVVLSASEEDCTAPLMESDIIDGEGPIGGQPPLDRVEPIVETG